MSSWLSAELVKLVSLNYVGLVSSTIAYYNGVRVAQFEIPTVFSPDDPGLIPSSESSCYSSHRPDQICDPHTLISNEFRVPFSWGKSAGACSCPLHIHQVQRSI
jgi:hypothetical protein